MLSISYLAFIIVPNYFLSKKYHLFQSMTVLTIMIVLLPTISDTICITIVELFTLNFVFVERKPKFC